MTNRMRIALIALMTAVAVGAGAKTVTLSRSALTDKIRGGWAGKTIGVAYGGPTEFKYPGRMIPDSVAIAWNDTLVRHYFDTFPGLYDDIYMDLTFVEVYERLGLNAPTSAFAHAFAHAGYPLWAANQGARYNILQGMEPPVTGYWKNNPHADDIDFQIEADYAGLMAPGMPQAAAYYTDSIGHIMSYGDGWYGGVYVATMFSLAFISNDVDYIVTEALKAIPEQSYYHKFMSNVIRLCRTNADWRDTWREIENTYGRHKACPDNFRGKASIDATVNSAYVIMGLLYGKGDFGRTIDISTRCGQDSDCNPSTAGGILGTMLGYSNIPDNWKRCIDLVEDRPFEYTDISLRRATELSTRHALKVIALNGGKTTAKTVKIKTQGVKPVRLEQSFEGMQAVGKRGLGNKPIDRVGAIRFNGNGVVVRGELTADDQDYVGLVEVTLDGKVVKTVKMPASKHSRANEIYCNFDLEDGDHTITLRRVNPQDNVKSRVYGIVVYKKK